MSNCELAGYPAVTALSAPFGAGLAATERRRPAAACEPKGGRLHLSQRPRAERTGLCPPGVIFAASPVRSSEWVEGLVPRACFESYVHVQDAQSTKLRPGCEPADAT